MAICATASHSYPLYAAQTIPYKMNFQGRLTDNAGNIKPDGLYNMQFRIYDTSSAGTQLWGETRETTARVQVTNGLFSTQLGDVTALPPGIFNSSSPRYFEITQATPATATCDTAGCATWESPMTPRQALGSAGYAMNADMIDGIDGANIAQLDQNNTFTGQNVFKTATNAVTGFQVQNASGISLLTVDTTNGRLGIGNAAPASRLEVGSNTTADETIVVRSQAKTGLQLRSDNANGTGEPGGAYVLFSQDGGGIQSIIGSAQAADTAPDGTTYSGVVSDSMVVGTKNGNSLHFGTGGSVQATIANGGATTFKNSANSTAAFQVQNAAGTNLLSIDTTNNIMYQNMNLVVQPPANSTAAVQIKDAAGNVIVSVDSTNKRVGINTTTPKTAMSVKGGNNISTEYPDGLAGTTVAFNLASTYTVPSGKNLWITSFANGSSSNVYLRINGVDWAFRSSGTALDLWTPVPAGSGMTVASSVASEFIGVSGLLIDASVTPVITTGGSYTVPAGKTFWLIAYRNGSTSAVYLQNGTILLDVAGANSFHTIQSAKPFSAGSNVNFSTIDAASCFIGYLTDSSGLGGP